jgi:hypothetical protein
MGRSRPDEYRAQRLAAAADALRDQASRRSTRPLDATGVRIWSPAGSDHAALLRSRRCGLDAATRSDGGEEWGALPPRYGL